VKIAGIILLAAVALVPIAAKAAPLPSQLDPPEPFPRVISDAPTIETIAPGVTSARYDLLTAAGPIVVRAIAVAPHRNDLRVDTVLAADALTSQGETISSMARRTNAVAGINADYFDIGNTNRPTNIVVRGGQLLRTPRKRYALVVTKSGDAHIVESTFTGQVDIAGKALSLDAVNEMPPPGGGISLITPEFGSVTPDDSLTLVALAPAGGTPPFTRYQVSTVADNTARQPPGYYLAIGLNAYGGAGVPNPGDIVVATGDLSPVALDTVASAVGGGPMILQNGTWFDDPDGPNGKEYALRIPSSGAAIEPDGTLVLIEVDGREPDASVGVTRAEFAALMRGLGATQGMAFDGGGSSEIAARDLVSADARLQNTPSDGRERRVADGIFVYSTAPDGPANRLVAQPNTLRAVPGASLDLRIAAIDEADRVVTNSPPISATVVPSSLGTYRDGTFVARAAGSGELILRSGSLSGSIPIDVTNEPARLVVLPEHPNVARGGEIRLSARAFDARGFPVALPPALAWTSNGARIAPNGMLEAGARDAAVALRVGHTTAGTIVTVGSHEIALPFAKGAAFMTVPRDGDGSVAAGADGVVELRYTLSPTERAAYAVTELPLPSGTIALSFDVRDDGSVRASALRCEMPSTNKFFSPHSRSIARDGATPWFACRQISRSRRDFMRST
jgi:hypothetical protein